MEQGANTKPEDLGGRVIQSEIYSAYIDAYAKLRKSAYHLMSQDEISETKWRYKNARSEFRILARAIRERAIYAEAVRLAERRWNLSVAVLLTLAFVTAGWQFLSDSLDPFGASFTLLAAVFGVGYLAHIVALSEVKSRLRAVGDTIYAQEERLMVLAPGTIRNLDFFDLIGIYLFEEHGDARLLFRDFLACRKLKISKTDVQERMEELGIDPERWDWGQNYNFERIYLGPSELIDLKIELAVIDFNKLIEASNIAFGNDEDLTASYDFVDFTWDYPTFCRHFAEKET